MVRCREGRRAMSDFERLSMRAIRLVLAGRLGGSLKKQGASVAERQRRRGRQAPPIKLSRDADGVGSE